MHTSPSRLPSILTISSNTFSILSSSVTFCVLNASLWPLFLSFLCFCAIPHAVRGGDPAVDFCGASFDNSSGEGNAQISSTACHHVCFLFEIEFWEGHRMLAEMVSTCGIPFILDPLNG
jgi:hypothetical protein